MLSTPCIVKVDHLNAIPDANGGQSCSEELDRLAERGQHTIQVRQPQVGSFLIALISADIALVLT